LELSKTAGYAVRILGYMAKEEESFYSAKLLSQELDIPYKYLTKIMTTLSKESLVVSSKGRDGGFCLAKKASEISVQDILDAFEQSGTELCILGGGKCNSKKKCLLHDKWSEPKKIVSKVFSETTLADIAG